MECWSELERVAFGRRLADGRRAKQLTQDDIAVIFDLGKQAVSHWERGRNQPTAEQLSILARELEVSADWLLSGRAAACLPPELAPERLASLPDDLLQQAIVRPTEPRIGPDSRLVERLPAVLACNSRPIAVLVGQALASQSNYSVACAGGDTMMVRCEYGTCRVMQ